MTRVVATDEQGIAELERCLEAGGVAVFPADTVYGLCCDPRSEDAVGRLNALKQRPPGKPSAVMFFGLASLLGSVALGPRTRDAATRLLPGPITLLVDDTEHAFPLSAPAGPLGLRVPILPYALGGPVLQSSANLAGEPEARALPELSPEIAAGADLLVDGGALPGRSSTVVDLTELETRGTWRVIREGALATQDIAELLGHETRDRVAGR